MNWRKLLEFLNRPALPGGKPILVAAIAVVLFLSSFIGYLFGHNRVPGMIEVPVIRYVNSEEMERELEDLRLEKEGLLNRIRGMVELGPGEIVILEDTIQGCPETAITEVRIAPFRSVSYGMVRLLSDSVPDLPLYQLSLMKDVDVSRCTQFYFNGDEFICDTPRLGVLDLFLYADLVFDPSHPISDQRILDAGLGLRWRRWPSSRWAIEAARDVNGWFTLGVRREFRLIGK